MTGVGRQIVGASPVQVEYGFSVDQELDSVVVAVQPGYFRPREVDSHAQLRATRFWPHPAPVAGAALGYTSRHMTTVPAAAVLASSDCATTSLPLVHAMT